MGVSSLLNSVSLLLIIGSLGAAAISTKFSRGAIPFISSIGLSSGVLYTFVGLVHMMAALDDPSKIHTAIFIATLCTLYGSLLWVLLGPFKVQVTPVNPLDFEPMRSRLGAVLWIGLFLGSMIHGGGMPFMSTWAFVITAVSLGSIFISVFSDEESSPYEFIEACISYLPKFGHIALWASLIMLIPQPAPAEIGPIIAVGFLSYIYTHSISISLALLFPQEVEVATESEQWLQLASAIIAAVGVCFFIMNI